MSRMIATLVALSLLLAVPAGIAEEDDGDADEATWGLCQAQEASEPGDEASNGTVSETPPFNDTSEEDCEDAERPANDSAGDLPGPDDHPDQDDNPGDENSEEAEDRGEEDGEDAEDHSDDGEDEAAEHREDGGSGDEGSDSRP